LTEEATFSTFNPALQVQDEYLSFWLQNVTLRMRREMCWNLRERSLLMNPETHVPGAFTDALLRKGLLDLNQVRYWGQKQEFFRSDITAKYLTNMLETKVPEPTETERGSLYWLAEQLNLDDTSIFVISLALACHLDAAIGNVISLCLNDPSKTQATLGLAQKLWDRPEEITYLADAGGILFRFGILEIPPGTAISASLNSIFELPIRIPTLVANQLINPSSLPLPSTLKSITSTDRDCDRPQLEEMKYISSRIMNKVAREKGLVVPILGIGKSSRLEATSGISLTASKSILEFVAADDRHLVENSSYLGSAMTYCWLRNADLFLDLEVFPARRSDAPEGNSFSLPLPSLPIVTYLGISEIGQLSGIPQSIMSPAIEVPILSYSDRVDYWKKVLGAVSTEVENSIIECARRFRFDKESIDRVCRTLRGLQVPIESKDLPTSCWLEADVNLGDFAQRVIPRFSSAQLILPLKQQLQFQEIINAIESLTRVHYEWNTGRAWNEAGISVLFAGPSGTGKTMAAEILSLKLGLPMFRIDLSQIVNKYIGETEKNLKKIFDKAEICDMILFFDEADSLFGRRTEVKDAHDRYANLEVNYLLERMERYKGLAILATNRKKDIDESFLRRLRYIIEFPLPDESQRKLIWHQSIPSSVDSSDIDIEFLAKQFQLTGGNIRSVVFNAALQSAHGLKPGTRGKITMESIVTAIKREYDKIKSSITLEQFGPYRDIIERIDID
jgi:DNA polymerase III delta prime subunit